MPSGPRAEFDRRMMGIALRVAERGLGNTAPNPSVGAVVVDEAAGEVVARGWTQPGGRPHAETEALGRAGERARGATLYATLEPCSHYGRTPPCADAVIAAGLKRVVVGIEDPDPRVAGRGLERMRAAGIEVERGVLARRCDWLTRGHILRVSERRPLTQVKMALGPGGEVPRGSSGTPSWVTGADARAHGHLLRARADAILVGGGTVEDDDPELTCRLPGLIIRSPVRVVLAGRNLPAPDRRLVKTAREFPVWIFGGEQVPTEQRRSLEAAGCRLIEAVSVEARPWLPAVMESLVALGVTRLLIEGGPTIWNAVLSAGLADEVLLYRAHAAAKVGAEGVASAASDLARYSGGVAFGLDHERRLGDDKLFVFRRKRGH